MSAWGPNMTIPIIQMPQPVIVDTPAPAKQAAPEQTTDKKTVLIVIVVVIVFLILMK